jgi:UDP-3-O-[3-hydroxymyristoyl] N-acetylglucosamine deacetylase
MPLPIDPHQYTLKKTVSCCGVGLHTGRTVNLILKPAPVHNGIRFHRSDLRSAPPLPAYLDKVVDTRLATTLGNGHFTVSTTEHLLAALKACGIDNVDIELDAAEVPIMDGSAEPFFQLLKNTGKKQQKSLRKVLRINKPVYFQDGGKKIGILPYNGFKVTGEINFDDTLIKTQKFSFDLNMDRFGAEIARARTFGYVEQVEELWANGLALGSSLANVIAIHWNRRSVLNEDGLRFEDEFIRHKVLDLIGDLNLLGCPVLGHVMAYKAGHAEHLSLMQEIISSPNCWDLIAMRKDGAHAVLTRLKCKSKSVDSLVELFSPAIRPTIVV